MLQPKYAKQLDSNIKELIANGGSNEDVEKMASDYTSLFSDEALKKKDNSDVTAQNQNLDSETNTGSLDIVGSNGFPAIDQNLGVPGLKPDLKTVEQLANPPKSKSTIQAEQNNALKYEKFKQFSALTDERKKENIQKAEDEANGVGFLNNVASFGKEVYNTAIEGMSNAPIFAGLKQLKANTEPLGEEKKEAKDLMIKQGVNPKDINYNSVLELAKKIKVQKLNDSDVESRKKDFLSDTDIDFEDLQKGANIEFSKISNKDKELLKQKAMLEPALKDSDNRLNQLNQQLANFKKNNQQPTPEFVDEYNYAIKYHNDIIKDVQKTDNQFAENRDKIGDLKTNLDLFKRQYGKVNNFVSNIGATALDLTAGGFGIVDYGFNAAYGALGVDTGPKESSEIVTGLKGASKSIRDRIAKPINIDNIEDVGDFGDWMANTVIANQIPIYGLIATGTGGIVALGGSSLGTKYGDMVQEMNPDHPVEGQILKNYSNAELAWKPVGFGIAETASALVDAHIMKGAARVLASATQPERRLISQTVARKLLDVGGQTVKGGVYEATDEMATQGVENLIDGKPFTEGMKDAGGAGGAMGALIPFFAGNIAIAAKPFSIDNKIQNSAKRTLALEKELANPSLSEDAKKIIQTNFEESKKTTENLLKKQVKDISKMSNENFQEILRIENEQAKLKEKAVEIKTQDGLSNDVKKQLLSDFSTKFNELEKDRVDILSGEKTMPKIEEKDAKVEIPITETEVEVEVQEPTKKQEVKQPKATQEQFDRIKLVETPDGTFNVIDEQENTSFALKTGLTKDEADTFLKEINPKASTEPIPVNTEPTSVLSENKVAPNVEGKDKVKEHISNLANDNYLFTHVTTEDNARNITENGMSVSLGTGISSTLTASGQESATNQAERLMNGEVVHRDLNNNSVAIISVPKSELDKMSGKSLAEKFENWLVENNHINDKGELAIPKELNAGYLSGQNFITNEKSQKSNSPANGNVQSRVEPMGENGITEQQSTAKESVPSAVDVGKGESNVEVTIDDIQNFINQTYLNDGKESATAEADQGAVENSNEENRAIPIVEKGKKQVKVTKEGKVSLQGRKALSKRQFKGDRKTASEIDPTDATSLALSYFVKGGKIAKDYFNSQGERQARSNGLNGIASAKGKTIDKIAHDIYESQENSQLKLSTEDIKNAIEEVVNGNLTVQDAVASVLGKYDVEKQDLSDYEKDYAEAIQEYQKEEDFPQEHIQEVESALDYLSDAEIIELANSNEKSFDDYVKDIESRQVTYDLGPISEQGTIQSDGWILSENGELLSPNSVRNVKQVNPGVKTVEKPKTLVSKESPELKEVNAKLEKANENLRIAKDALDRKAKSLDKELLKDNEDLFGARKSQSENKLFDERVDADARNKATEKERNAISDAQKEIKSLTEEKAKIESGEIVSTSEMDFEDKNKVRPKEVENPTNVGRMISASSRFRPAQRVDFEKPVIGPNGNKLVSYQWTYEWTEQPNREGELKPKRTSDWDQAESSAATGRDIVHQFTIEKTNGETITVSSESVPFELGYAEKSQMKDLPSLVSAVKTLAKNKMKLAILEAQLKEYEDLKDKYQKIIPEIKEIKEPTNFGPVQEAYSNGEHKVFAIDDVWVRQSNKYNEKTRGFDPINSPDKFTIIFVKEDWVNKRVKENGGKFPRDIVDLRRRVERQEKKIGLVNSQEIDAKQQLKNKANAEVDRIAQKVKDLLPGIKDPNVKLQGISQDDLIDLVASAVKALISKGIDVNDAIRQVAASIKERFNVDVDENLVKAKLGVDVPRDFERKQGKKSFAGRGASGNSAIIKKAIAKYSLDYEIENQKEAKLKAEMFVDEVGVDNALIAVRKGLIDGAQGAFIYARTIEILEQEINFLKGEDKLDAIADYQELLGQISDELDNRSRSNGRFIAALAEIYNSSGGRYNLTKMVNDYKAQNNGVISKEVLEKLKNVEQKLKESEEKLAELEAKKRIEEENEAFNNILEAVARRKRINTYAKINDKQKAKAFADKLLSYKISNRANLSAATPFSIAYDLAIDAAAKAIIATGYISDAIKAGVNSIRNSKLSKDEQEQALSDLFDLFDDSDVNGGKKGMMSVDEEGVLRIPHSLIREKVENGIDNIDDLVSALMTDVQELFPDLDFTERQVRDIVTGYGKISNPTSDEIEVQISIMKSLGKIASGLEDVNKGQRPLRSGQQRREPTMQERVEMKKLKALLRDLPLAEADITKAYKTALDAIKKRLSNEIEELDNQIANGEKRKGEKTVIEYDQEAKDLKAVRDAKKAELDELVGKPELTEQQKIDRAEKILQKRLDDLQQKIDANEIDYAKKPETVTSAKLEEMRKLKKEYEAQIQKMREDSGLAEERLIEIAKRNASKRLATLKERIAKGDFEKRKRKPTPTDVELNKIKSEIAEQKEIFDKEVYKLELKNRRIEQKAFDVLKDILSIPKILSFTSDLSFVGIQNVTQIYKMGANSLINLAKTGKLKGVFRDAMAKTFKAMANPNFEQKYMQAVKANPNYQLWKDSKLGIVESHYKESAKAEVFQHNAITTLFDILGNYVASKGYEKAGNIIKNYVNIISIFERGQTVFENQMRINRFQEGADLLKAQGLNPIDDIQEYRKVAAAVNTLTGRANTGSKAAAALREANGTIFSSFSNWAAGVNQLNPYWYYTLTPTARKMALTDVAHHIVGAGSLLAIAALYALGQDDDDEDKIVVGTTPTSSDFALIKAGNLRIDPWAGKKTTIVAFSRLVNGGKTDKYGNFKKYGIEYEDEDWIDLPLEYAGNKIAPGPRFALDRFFKTRKVEYQGKSFREDKYGVDFKESKYLIPLIFENFKEVNEEQPNLFGKAAMALSWTGLINTNVYGGAKEGFKDMPDDLVEKQYKVKIQKLKDNEKILDSNVEKLTKDYVEKKINKFQIMQKVDSLVDGDVELYNKSIKSIIEKVNKEELKTLVSDPFYLGLKKEKNPQIQAILFYSKFKDDEGMSEKDKKERDRNLQYIEFDVTPKFIKAYQELKNSKKKPIN